MTAGLVRASRICSVLGVSLVAACQMPNPEFDGVRDEVGGTEAGDGDGESKPGDGDGEPSTGDGDGAPGDGDGEPGDGDGEPGTGDGDGDANVCPEGYEECNGGCVDLQFDFNHCGGCGSACEGGQICGQGDCLPKKYVFVSTHLFPGDFGGPEGALSKCNDLATEAELPGEYRPWVSTSQQSPLQYLGVGVGAYVLRNGPVVAWSWEQFISGQHLAPINRNQFGELIPPSEACEIDFAVWTGTSDMGQLAQGNCTDWTTIDANAKGRVGNAGVGGPGWSASACEASCSLHLPVYCVQQ